MIKAASILSIPVYVTTQNAEKLGGTVEELDISAAKHVANKSCFTMCIQEIVEKLGDAEHVAIVGIESHICVLQSALDLLAMGKVPYVLVDGVSSCNKEEIGVALARLRAAGAQITTSESFIYQVMGDAAIPEFRQVAAVVRDTKKATRDSLSKLSLL